MAFVKKIKTEMAESFKPASVFVCRYLYTVSVVFLLFCLALLVGLGYLLYQNSALLQANDALYAERQILQNAYYQEHSTLEETRHELLGYKENLRTTQEQRDFLAKNLEQEKEKVATKEEEVGKLSTTIEKLTTLDPELLQKYSKVFFLSENYVPQQLFPVPDKYKYYEERDVSVLTQVWPYLQGLLLRAEREGITLYILSGYRSFDRQANLKSKYKVIYGSGTANQFSADQGYSEHQLGTTLDFITTGLGGQLYGFDKTEAYEFMKKYAHEYGFTLSYPEKNGYYIFEPWHWRFVGIKLATYLHEQGKNFHDLSQRELDKYLLTIFD